MCDVCVGLIETVLLLLLRSIPSADRAGDAESGVQTAPGRP